MKFFSIIINNEYISNVNDLVANEGNIVRLLLFYFLHAYKQDHFGDIPMQLT